MTHNPKWRTQKWLNQKSIKDVVDYWAKKKNKQVFAIEPNNETITFGELKNYCQSFVEELRQAGHKAGDNVAYATNNGTDAIKIIIGTMYGGYVATAINLVAGPETISYVVKHSKTKIIFAQDKTKNVVQDAIQKNTKKNVEIKNLNQIKKRKPKTKLNPKTQFNPKPNNQALLMYTSGTTGKPKGVIHTHKSIIAGGKNTVVAHQLSQCDTGLCSLPLYHINAFCVSLIGILISGGKIIIPEKFSVSEFDDVVQKYKCSWCSLVPTQIAYIIQNARNKKIKQNKFKTLRFARSASAPLAPDVQQNFENTLGVPIIETMGLTETAAQILANPINGKRKTGSPGVPVGNKIIIADKKLNKIKNGEEGEIVVRGDNIMSHYKDNKKETNKTITKNKWLRTGDLGKMDDDGFVFVTGRIKELIIKGGENIAPREIDEALYTHPDVVEAAAFPCKCDTYGENIEAAVVIDKKSNITPNKLIKLCTDKIGKFKTPSKIYIMDELPKGPSGKIQRRKVAEITQNI